MEVDTTNRNIGQDIVRRMRKWVNKFEIEKKMQLTDIGGVCNRRLETLCLRFYLTLHWGRLLVTNNKAIRFEPRTRKMNRISCIRGTT